ncbi:EF-hand_domain [Hexamita inflata]|uniref:EF-hand domain n=1 Tax=Hexamita inflata TaxID=28002 RepID=A0AA86PSA4_9EUKA|nr:EF-hand domain [Hexamita inflata]CAI9944382.1 EF-hand domain [Hexamita inflata]CAI9945254.1 EF-hand domain [Hexamita inflata]CAI9964427.1 EF-hand domain [Hexamita inflata]CAI9972995.1 EF-hand domain [Hexamita inflata]
MKYSTQDFERLFEEADLNKDKKINYIELQAFLKSHKMEPNPDRLRKYFGMFDRDQSASLDIKEWVRFMEVLFADKIL